MSQIIINCFSRKNRFTKKLRRRNSFELRHVRNSYSANRVLQTGEPIRSTVRINGENVDEAIESGHLRVVNVQRESSQRENSISSSSTSSGISLPPTDPPSDPPMRIELAKSKLNERYERGKSRF